MSKLFSYLKFLFCGVMCLFAASITNAQEEQASVSAKDVAIDDGTSPAGDVIIAKRMALHCGISSKDGRDKEKIKECFEKLASEGIGVLDIEQEMMHQLSKDALEKALTIKSAAGNYEATREDELEEDNNIQAGSAAAGGALAASGSDLRSKQEKNIKMSARSSGNLLKAIDIYSARLGLDTMEAFFRLDAPYRLSKQQEEED